MVIIMRVQEESKVLLLLGYACISKLYLVIYAITGNTNS